MVLKAMLKPLLARKLGMISSLYRKSKASLNQRELEVHSHYLMNQLCSTLEKDVFSSFVSVLTFT